MNTIKVSMDRESFWSKPAGQKIAKISERIAKNPKTLNLHEIKEFVDSISIDGCTFCPATFKDGKRSKENFEQQQLFALDFDNKDSDRKISLDEIITRSKKYNLPILFAYDTLSSTEHDKFRVVFLNDSSISHIKVAEAMQLAMGTIFPEADSSCYRDASKMYFGGKERRYYDNAVPTINIESVFRGLTYYFEDRYKKNHYKEKLLQFSQATGIALNDKGFLDVTVTNDLTESIGANQSNGKRSPALIYSNNIIANGEIFPNKCYKINLNDCTAKSSVTTSVDKTDVVLKDHKNHNAYRKSDVDKMSQVCRLYQEFESGSRDMSHPEIFGILNNLINADSGSTRFKEILLKHPKLYDSDRRAEWERHLSYNSKNDYKPSSCDNFCPYKNECNHGKNILSTVRPKHGMMERIPGYREEFSSLEEMQNDTYEAISRAFHATDSRIYIIKSVVGSGKSYSYLQLMEENPGVQFLIAAPTNLLKNELCNRAEKNGVDVRKTPSLEEIKDDIPCDVWEHIQILYMRGQYNAVHPYIQEKLDENSNMKEGKKKKEKLAETASLRKYMKERSELKYYHGNLITTHRYLLTMDRDRLNDFDAIIIDEDILFKSVLPNQEEIPISTLKNLMKKTTDKRLYKKIMKLLKLAKKQSCIELDSFELDDKDIKKYRKYLYDLSSFCQAEQFYVRRVEKEKNLKEDTVTFLKPASLAKAVKYIIVSATADEAVYRQYFGEDRVDFYQCKKAEYMGVLYQYPERSMSRSSIANDPGIVRRLMNRFHMSEDRVITFMRENIGDLHFGNTEGSNTLEGKDILVIGTPYHAEFLYKLAAFTIGWDFDEEEEVQSQIVTHNGYRFRFTTFENEKLRAIQFWMLESELEQAVGRARLLRNSCEAHLFSNFPLSQAKMVEGFDYHKE